MSENVVTVRQEVQLALNLVVADYAERAKSLSEVANDKSLDAFYLAVLAELASVAEAYRRRGAEEIRVGDTVRITFDYSYDGSNLKGTEFVVTEVVPSTFEHGQFVNNDPAAGLTSTFYVQGDPARRGVWEQYIEKVHK